MDNELFDRINLHPPETALQAVLLVTLVAAIGVAAWRRAGLPFAVVAATLGLVCYVVLEPHPYIPLAILLALMFSPRPALDEGERRRAALFLREILILAVGLLLYDIGRMLTVGKFDDAIRNAERLVSFQRAIGLPSEAPVQELILRNYDVVRVFNRIYSWGFLSTVVGVLVWLYLNDRRIYKVFRAGLGVACAMTIATVAVFPVAPPRLLPGSGLVSTHELMGRTHGFLNPYAAVPSNHVGWSVLAGVVLAIGVGGRRGVILGAIPALTMAFTVLATGHHYWLDGVIGSVYSLSPLAALGVVKLWRMHKQGRLTWEVARPVVLGGVRWVADRAGTILLSLLLAWLLIGQLFWPGFTDFWGYQVAQVSFTLAVIGYNESRRGRLPVFTWETRAIVVGTTYADCLGTAGDFYARFASYDKITHFAGTAAATAVAFEVIAHLARQGKVSWLPATQVVVAVGIGFFLGIAWEVYEYLGDRVFSTGRHHGWIDTQHDIISDTAGAVVAALLVARRRAEEEEPATQPAPGLAEAD